jgi:hypothetical protein
VTGYVPAGVDDDVPIVNVLPAPEFTDEGLNDAVTPAGKPDADNDTDCADPDVTAVATDTDADPPAVSDPDEGLTETEKSFGGGGGVEPEVFSAVSSRTKLVVPPLVSFSVPVNLTVTLCPAYADRSTLCWT